MEGAAPAGAASSQAALRHAEVVAVEDEQQIPLPAGAEDHANQLGPVVVNLSGCPLYSVGKGLEHVVTALGSA